MTASYWSVLRHVTPTCRIDPAHNYSLGAFLRLCFGKNVSIGALTLLSLEATQLAPEGLVAVLEIGDSTYIGEMNNLRADHGIKIGSKCMISQGVSIEDGVWIGAHFTILPGVTRERRHSRYDQVMDLARRGIDHLLPPAKSGTRAELP